MSKLQSFTVKVFQQATIFQLFSDLLHTINASTGETLNAFIKPPLDVFRPALNNFDAALLAVRKANAPIELDEKRDWGIRELNSIASVYEDHFLNQEKQQAALFLLAIFKRYGTGADIAAMPQDKESATLTNILQEFTADAAKTHTAALDVTALIDYIDTNNKAFIDARRNVTEENMLLAGQTKAARTATENAWRSLHTAINGYLAVYPTDEACVALINSLNAIIDRYKSNARRGKGKKTDDAAPENQAG